MKLIISFIIFLSTLYLVSSQLKLPFQTKFNISNVNKDDIMKTLIDNDIFVQISIGSNNQIIDMNIKLGKEATYILSDSCPVDILSQKFNENNSATYKIMIEKSLYFIYDFKDATLSKDKVALILENNKKIKMMTFILC